MDPAKIRSATASGGFLESMMRRCVLAVVLAATGMVASAAPSVFTQKIEEAPPIFSAMPVDQALGVASVGLVDAPVSRVPEPGIYAMVFAGLAVIVWKVRRNRRR
jgi:hypothetical protein